MARRSKLDNSDYRPSFTTNLFDLDFRVHEVEKCNYGEFARKAEDLWTMGVADRARCLNIWNDPDGWVTPRKTCGESVTKRSTAGGLQMPGDYGVYPPAGY
ncbi:hypothetical protein HZH66_005394 [Vespula vulgaris]|uniref:Uncharacterized protein n=1 Tax=Vespula vulgaris TaxID=7454 RepID=A0A834NBF0_VESVU|nr:hypothetical protein HZH66_005394 [Vespula vulgaris]